MAKFSVDKISNKWTSMISKILNSCSLNYADSAGRIKLLDVTSTAFRELFFLSTNKNSL